MSIILKGIGLTLVLMVAAIGLTVVGLFKAVGAVAGLLSRR